METAIRYVGLDVHKRHVMIAAVNDQQEIQRLRDLGIDGVFTDFPARLSSLNE